MSDIHTKRKGKPPYSFTSNIIFVLKGLYRYKKHLTISIFVVAPFLVATPFLAIYLSQAVVTTVISGSLSALITVILVTTALLILLRSIEHSLNAGIEHLANGYDHMLQVEALEKTIYCDYEFIESPTGLTMFSKALENMGGDNSPSRLIAYNCASFMQNLIGTFFYGFLLYSLTPWLLPAVGIPTLCGFFLIKLTSNWIYRNKDNWKIADRKLAYLEEKSGTFAAAKDLRLYSMATWFTQMFTKTMTQRRAWHKKEAAYDFKVELVRILLSIVREGIAYGSLIFLMYQNGMPVGDFVLYFGVIGGFSEWMNGLVHDIDSLHKAHISYCDIRAFFDIKSKFNNKNGVALPTDELLIEFKNVSYRYPTASTDTLKNLSFTIHKGEKLAIVGINGAGKTTLVKLLCGLYSPTSGEILVNGHRIEEYNIDEYYSMFATVFQDIYPLPLSIAKNISTSDDTPDPLKIRECLNIAGLGEKISSLKHGIDTHLVKEVSYDAIDLSGGELQKFALARALYKGGKALILDEPTAALDPIAESKIYENYNIMAHGKTSLFISHRLASTRFCNRIFFFENGKIEESGTHDELIKMGGKYNEMFEVQSHYYKEGATEDYAKAYI